jgi:hypothetical protein
VSVTNAPVVDLAQALEPSRLADYLNYEFSEHSARAAELAAAFERFLLATKDGINDDAATGRATDFAKMHKAELAAIDVTRSRIKAPVLSAQRQIDGIGKKLTDPLRASVAIIEDRMAAYLRRKAETARREAEAEAQRLAAAAHEAMREAETTPEQTADAIAALAEAQQAEALATASTPELTRTRSLHGALAGLRETWTYEVEDIQKVPAAYLTVNDAVVKAAIKTGVRAIPGIRVFAETKAYVR